MTYTQNWFEITAKANFTKYLEKYKGKPNLRFLEIGCFEGMATKWLLDNVLTDPGARITVIDTFEGSVEHKVADIPLKGMKGRFIENIGADLYKVEIKEGYSNKVLRGLHFGQYDFVYIDGSHRASDALQDIVLSFDLARDGATIIFDDYAWNNHPDHLNACIAMDAFLACYVGQYSLLLKEYQIVIEKIANLE